MDGIQTKPYRKQLNSIACFTTASYVRMSTYIAANNVTVRRLKN